MKAEDPRDPRRGHGRQGHHQEHHRVRRVRRPRRHRRPAPHHRHELGPRQPPERGVPGRRRGHGQGPQVQRRDRARLAWASSRPRKTRGTTPKRRTRRARRSAARSCRITDYGAFVELEPGVEGLIHVSEMSWTKKVKHPSKLLEVGQEIECQVLEVDARAKRISLGLKQLEPDPWTLFTDKYHPGDKIGGKVRSLTDYGVFVGIEEGVDGMVHKSDLSWTVQGQQPERPLPQGRRRRSHHPLDQPRREEGLASASSSSGTIRGRACSPSSRPGA